MAISQAMCTSFKGEVLQEGHQLATDTLKIALFTSSASLGASTTAYSTSNEMTGTGYTAGGETLANATVGTSGVVGFFDCDDPAWTSATFTANGALIYNYSNSNKAIAVLAFGADYSVSGGTFTIELPAAGTSAIIRID
jgi:hypothetical protein